MREFRDGSAWTAASSGYQLERELFESVRTRRPKPSNWKPGSENLSAHTEDDLIPRPEQLDQFQERAFEPFLTPARTGDTDGLAARFRAIGAADLAADATDASDRLDEALRRLRSERP